MRIGANVQGFASTTGGSLVESYPEGAGMAFHEGSGQTKINLY
jgi:hypothetical protein